MPQGRTDRPLRQGGRPRGGGGLGPGIRWAADAVLAALRGEVPDNVFNPDALTRWRERFAGNALIA